jgi:two-component sensor histidine kinase
MADGTVEMRMMRLAAGGFRLTISDDGNGIPAKVRMPSSVSLGGMILTDLLDGLDGSINVNRGAAGTVITVDVPAGHDGEPPALRRT